MVRVVCKGISCRAAAAAVNDTVQGTRSPILLIRNVMIFNDPWMNGDRSSRGKLERYRRRRTTRRLPYTRVVRAARRCSTAMMYRRARNDRRRRPCSRWRMSETNPRRMHARSGKRTPKYTRYYIISAVNEPTVNEPGPSDKWLLLLVLLLCYPRDNRLRVPYVSTQSVREIPARLLFVLRD